MSVEVVEPEAITDGQEEPSATVEKKRAVVADVLHHARLLILGMWLGASAFFSFVVAPGVFAVLRDSTALYPNHLAGTIVTRTLAFINTSGFIISLLLLLSAHLFRSRTGRRAFFGEVSALAIIAVTTGVGQWVIAARMLALRGQMIRPIDETALSDPLRVAFNSLHGYSVAALTLAMLAALIAFIFMARKKQRSEVRG